MAINDAYGISAYSSSALFRVLETQKTQAITNTNAIADAYPSTNTPISLDRVSISIFGKQISQMYGELKKIQDPELRQSAMDGMREVVLEMASDTPGESLGLLRAVQDLGDSDRAEFFATADKVAEDNLGLSRYLDTFVALDSTEERSAFIAEATSIVEDTSEDLATRQATFSMFIDIVNELDSADVSEEERSDALSSFFDELTSQATLDDKFIYLGEYGNSTDEGTA